VALAVQVVNLDSSDRPGVIGLIDLDPADRDGDLILEVEPLDAVIFFQRSPGGRYIPVVRIGVRLSRRLKGGPPGGRILAAGGVEDAPL